MSGDIVLFLELIGTVAFSVSGAITGLKKKMDISVQLCLQNNWIYIVKIIVVADQTKFNSLIGSFFNLHFMN